MSPDNLLEQLQKDLALLRYQNNAQGRAQIAHITSELHTKQAQACA
jgi:hypothetical protein